MDFGRPNVEIGWKTVNDQLLFLILGVVEGRVSGPYKLNTAK